MNDMIRRRKTMGSKMPEMIRGPKTAGSKAPEMIRKRKSVSELSEIDNRMSMNDADDRAAKFRTDAMMEEGYKKGGKVPKGMHMMPDGKMMKDSAHKKPKKKMMGGGAVKYAKGGSVDGCAVRGKTKGRMV